MTLYKRQGCFEVNFSVRRLRINYLRKVVITLEWDFDFSERMENLSYAIGYYRKKQGYSQERLAEILDISRQHLASVEAPGMSHGLSLDLLFKIATVLEVEPYLLLKFRLEK